MTEYKKTSYTTPGSHNVQIPSRNEFHRYHSNLLHMNDFKTDDTYGYQIQKVATAIKMTLSSADRAKEKQIYGW